MSSEPARRELGRGDMPQHGTALARTAASSHGFGDGPNGARHQ